MRTGKCEDVRGGGREARRAPRQLRALAASSGSGSAPRARIRGARWQDQRIIDTPHYRRTTSCCATSSGATTPSASTSTSASAAPTARSRVCNALRALPARAARALGSSPFVEGVDTACIRRARRSSRASSPAAASPTPTTAGTGGGVRPLPLPDGLDHRAHADLVERAAAPRLPDRRDPHLRRAARPRRGAARSRRSRYSLAARSPARSTRASRCRTCRTGCSRRTSGGRSGTG